MQVRNSTFSTVCKSRQIGLTVGLSTKSFAFHTAAPVVQEATAASAPVDTLCKKTDIPGPVVPKAFYRRRSSVVHFALNSMMAGHRKDLFGHPFHLLNASPLPFMLSLVFFGSALHLISVLKMTAVSAFGHGLWLSLLAAVITTWFYEAYREENSGAHTLEVQRGFRVGIVLFIVSELMLFISFFWGYFHMSLNPNIWIGGMWAPAGIEVFYWWRVPFLNTLLLLSSGLSLTIAHAWVVTNDKWSRFRIWSAHLVSWMRVNSATAGRFTAKSEVASENIHAAFVAQKLNVAHDMNEGASFRYWLNSAEDVAPRTAGFSVLWVFDTVVRGFAFLVFQVFEYIAAFFTIADSVYGSLFFSLTGLHGFHVFVGVLFLAMSMFSLGVTERRVLSPYRFVKPQFSFVGQRFFRTFTHRIAFDGAVWYWHFVDVVWLFVLLFVYW